MWVSINAFSDYCLDNYSFSVMDWDFKSCAGVSQHLQHSPKRAATIPESPTEDATCLKVNHWHIFMQYGSTLRGAFGVKYLAQGHLDILKAGNLWSAAICSAHWATAAHTGSKSAFTCCPYADSFTEIKKTSGFVTLREKNPKNLLSERVIHLNQVCQSERTASRDQDWDLPDLRRRTAKNNLSYS